MIKGFYTSLSGILASITRQAIVADNMANMNTTGFHQSRSTTTDFGYELSISGGRPIGRLGTATIATALTLDRAQGPLEQTGKLTDFAIEGDGLFVIAAPGGTAYTRAGDFVIDATGLLVTQDGYPVLDTAGQRIQTDGTLEVAPDGTILGTGQRIALVAWPTGELTRIGDTLFAAAGALTPLDGVIRQRMLEHSNTDTAKAMTELITLQRHFSLSSRALSIQDETIGDAIALGRLR
jgi:flagellar basal-body rod protein FlgF